MWQTRGPAALREELERRYRATLAAAAQGAHAAEAAAPLRLPPAVRETLVGLGALLGGCPEPLVRYYCERTPLQRLEQLLGAPPPAPTAPAASSPATASPSAPGAWPAGTPAFAAAPSAAARLLRRRLDLAALPRLAEALLGAYRALAAAGVDPAALLCAPDPAALLAARPTVEALYAPTLFGAGVPLLGLSGADLALYAAELAAGVPPDELVDRRLSGNLMHELCHGPGRERAGPPPPWMVIEAAAIHLGGAARRAHVFPEEPGEAVPGVSLFVLVGSALARLFGAGALYGALTADRLDDVLPPRPAAALAAAGWQDLLARREPPLVRDALRAFDWIKLADAARLPPGAGAPLPANLDAESDPRTLPDLLDLASRLSPLALPWAAEPPDAADDALVDEALDALFQVNVIAPTYQTHPDEVPGGRLVLDVDACALSCAPRPAGVFGEPARWIFPPPLCRRLRDRGARRVVIEGARRARRREVAAALRDLCAGTAPLPAEPELRWTSSAPR